MMLCWLIPSLPDIFAEEKQPRLLVATSLEQLHSIVQED